HLAIDGCDTRKVPVVVADNFVRGAALGSGLANGSIPAGYLSIADKLPGFSIVPTTSGSATHGYDVATTLAGLFDERNPTGANPFTSCLDLRGIQVGGLTPRDEIDTIVRHLPGGRFILNYSRAFIGRCVVQVDFTNGGALSCDSASFGDIPTAADRAEYTEEW